MHLNARIAKLLNELNNPSLPGIDLSLERMWQLLKALGDPQNKLPPAIHVAGTNGKGSTIAFLRAIYQKAGYKVHSYTSPHLVRFNERIVIAGKEIPDEQLLPILERVAKAAKKIPVTFFEATTAAAFLAFSEHKADVVLLETGLGGRLDATNVVKRPILTIITPIDYDHMEFLGDTLEKIAAEKAGIMKPGVPCVVGAQPESVLPVLARAAYAIRAPLYVCGKAWNAAVTAKNFSLLMDTVTLALPFPALPGAHQIHNAGLAAAAVKTCEELPVNDEAIAEGIRNATWPARLQQLKTGPLVDAWSGAVMLDGAHNESAARALVEWIKRNGQPVTLVLGMMKRKDPTTFLNYFTGHVERLIAAPIAGEECHSPDSLVKAARQAGIDTAFTCASMAELPQKLYGREEGTLLITGSLFLAGEVLKNHG